MDNQQELDLFKTLGRIEAKIHNLCGKDADQKQDIKDLSDKMDAGFKTLPCNSQYEHFEKNIKKKIDLKLFFAMIGLFVMIIGGSYIYAQTINNDLKLHQLNNEIHCTEGCK